MVKKNFCFCASVNQHLPHCPLRNQGLRADFPDILKIFKKLEKDYGSRDKTRDQKRIPKILKRLEKLWLRNPDLRLGQLIYNLFVSHLYYVEDEDLIRRLEVFYDKKRR